MNQHNSLFHQFIIAGQYDQKRFPNITKTYYHYVMDISGSVQQQNFNKMCTAVKTHVQSLDVGTDLQYSRNAFSLFRFNDHTIKDINLGVDRQKLIQHLSNEKIYEGGTTDAQKALQTLYQYAKEHSKNDVHQLILIVTDGDLGQSQQIITQINQEQNFSVGLLLMFVQCEVPLEFLKQFPMLQQYQIIKFDTFKDLEEVFNIYQEYSNDKPYIVDIQPQIKQAEIIVNMQPKSTTLLNNTISKYILEIYEEQNQNIPFQVVTSQFNQIYVTRLMPSSKYRARVQAVFQDQLISSFSEELEFNTLPLNALYEYLQNENKLLNKLRELKEKIIFGKQKKKFGAFSLNAINILMLGLMGHGKSSFINSILSTYLEKYVPARIVMKSSDTVTKQFEKINLSDYLQDPIIKEKYDCEINEQNQYINFYDIFGIRYIEGKPLTFESSNFYECFEHIKDGTLAEGYQEWSRLDKNSIFQQDDPLVKLCRKIHTTVYCFDINSVASTQEMKKIKEFLQLSTNKGLRYIVVLTKADTVEANVTKIKDIYQNQKIEQMRQIFANETNAKPEDVFLFSNFTSHFNNDERDFGKEFLLMWILDYIIGISEIYIGEQLNQFFLLQNHTNEPLFPIQYQNQGDKMKNFIKQISEGLQLLKIFDKSENVFLIKKTKIGNNMKIENIPLSQITDGHILIDFYFKEDEIFKVSIGIESQGYESDLSQKDPTLSENLINHAQGVFLMYNNQEAKQFSMPQLLPVKDLKQFLINNILDSGILEEQKQGNEQFSFTNEKFEPIENEEKITTFSDLIYLNKYNQYCINLMTKQPQAAEIILIVLNRATNEPLLEINCQLEENLKSVRSKIKRELDDDRFKFLRGSIPQNEGNELNLKIKDIILEKEIDNVMMKVIYIRRQ